MTLEQMKAQLGMESVPEVFESLYEQVKDTWQDRAALILSDDFITDVIERSGQMTAYVEQILAGAKGVRENPAMCLLVCILEAYMGLDTKPDNSYIAPEGEGVTYDMLHLFPTMPAILKVAENFRNRNVPADVIANTMKIYTDAKTVEFENVLVGDVYMVIGQSNVAYNFQTYLYASSTDKQNYGANMIDETLPIRLHYNTLNEGEAQGYPKRGTTEVCPDVVHNRTWERPTNASVGRFTAIGYCFAWNFVQMTAP